MSVSFSPDGKYIVSGAYDNTVKIWSLKEVNGEKMWLLEKEICNSESALFTSDAVIENTVNLLDEYQRVFEQRKAKINVESLIKKNLDTYDSYDKDMNKYKLDLEKELIKNKLEMIDFKDQKQELIKVDLKAFTVESEESESSINESENESNSKVINDSEQNSYAAKEDKGDNPIINEESEAQKNNKKIRKVEVVKESVDSKCCTIF